jgi:hypothetical protein
MIQHDYRYRVETQLEGGEVSAMTGENSAFRVRKNRCVEAEGCDAPCDLRNLGVRNGSWDFADAR